jgi:hypothetical protein
VGVGGTCDGKGGGDIDDRFADLNVLWGGGVLGASSEETSRESEEAMSGTDRLLLWQCSMRVYSLLHDGIDIMMCVRQFSKEEV